MPYTANERRYEAMQYARCGKSGLKLPRVSLGLWHNFGSCDAFDNMRAMLRAAFDCGITHIDMANNYGPVPGAAEENFGRILKKTCVPTGMSWCFPAKRDIPCGPALTGISAAASICWPAWTRASSAPGWSISIFFIPIGWTRRPRWRRPWARWLAVQQGKALYAGISNYDGETTARAAAILKELHCPFIINQSRYSIFDRTIEKNGLKAYAAAHGVGIIAFSPLAQGLLTDKYLHGVPADSRIKKSGVFLKESALTPERLAQIAALNELAAARGQTLAQMALSWVLKDSGVTSVLIGASRPQQIVENAAIVNAAPFTQQELDEIERIAAVR